MKRRGDQTKNRKEENPKQSRVYIQTMATQTITIVDLGVDAINYMMFMYLTPYAIMNCYRAHRCFHVLSEYQLNLTKTMAKVTILGAITSNNHVLFDHIYRIHAVKTQNPIGIRLDITIPMCINHNNLHAFTRLLNDFGWFMNGHVLGKCLFELYLYYYENRDISLLNAKQFMISELNKLCETKNIDINTLTIDQSYVGAVNLVDEIFRLAMDKNDLNLLKHFATNHKLDIPMRLLHFRRNVSDEMRDYILLHGV